MKRILEKIQEIVRFIDELDNITPSTLEEYKANLEKKAACERYVEKIIEAVTDLAFLVIKINKFRMPDDDIDAFTVLLENKFIDENLADRLQSAKGMRNIIAHQYGKVNDKIVFKSITEDLENDVKDFIDKVEKSLISKTSKKA